MFSKSLLLAFAGLALAARVPVQAATTTVDPVPVQPSNDVTLDGCYPVAMNNSGPLNVLKTAKTPNGFKGAARGYNTYGSQANTATTPSFSVYDQAFVKEQCGVLAGAEFQAAGYIWCSMDAGWNTNDQDKYGRTLYNSTLFDLPKLADFLHERGLKLGIYIIPGAPCSVANRTIKGTDVTLGEVYNGNQDGLGYCDFNYSLPATQTWHDSTLELWTGWGVDMIKLDFVTPGSPSNGLTLPANNSGAALAYHQAILNVGKEVRLDLSWKLCRNDTYYDIWRTAAESMRTDQDINNSGATTFVAWQTVQREIDNYRQYIALQVAKTAPLTIHPDMDNLYVGNAANITGVTDAQRTTMMSVWIGAASNLIVGSDLTNLDALGRQLITSKPSVAAADFCSAYPMQPRNPGTGNNLAQQLQAWIAGPDDSGTAYALLSNLGPTLGNAGYNSTLNGTQTVAVTFGDLGLAGSCYRGTDVWAGSKAKYSGKLSADLDEGESKFLKLVPCKGGYN